MVSSEPNVSKMGVFLCLVEKSFSLLSRMVMMVKVQKQISVPTKQPWESILPFPKQGQFGVSGEVRGEQSCLCHSVPESSSLIPHQLHFSRTLCTPHLPQGLFDRIILGCRL